MASMGAEIRFDKDKCLVLKDGKEFAIGRLLPDKLYTVNTIEYAQVSTVNSAPSLTVWHCRLGYLKYTYVNQLMEKEMVECMHYDADSETPKGMRSMCSWQNEEAAFSEAESTQSNQTIRGCTP